MKFLPSPSVLNRQPCSIAKRSTYTSYTSLGLSRFFVTFLPHLCYTKSWAPRPFFGYLTENRDPVFGNRNRTFQNGYWVIASPIPYPI
ncbi:unnamed protein product [Laminaria digitata]